MTKFNFYLRKWTRSGNYKVICIPFYAETVEEAKEMWSDDKRCRNTDLLKIEKED